jgi:hypothetical protein
MAQRQVRLWTVLLPLLTAGGMLRRVLPFHYHRHCTHVSFTAVLGVDVLQHCVSSKRSSVSNVSVEVLDTHRVKASNTDEGQTVLLSNDAVHIIKEYRMSSGVHVISITFGLSLGCCTDAFSTVLQDVREAPSIGDGHSCPNTPKCLQPPK